jgi:hypothetical protein
MAVELERATRCVMSLSQSRESGRPPDETETLVARLIQSRWRGGFRSA